MTSDEYAEHDGMGLAALVRAGEVSAVELVDAAVERIEARNGVLNAVVHKAYDEARATAAGDLPDGPFRGVPFLVKDLAMPVAGWPRTSGSRFCAGVVDAADGGLTGRYRGTGAVLLGKANTSEYGIVGSVEGAYLGACRNPWNVEHTPGGSSGGSASAVAAGFVPLAHASDGLGSIRIPAACCGLVGMKGTRDRITNLPDGFDYAMGFVVDHVVSRTVRDSAAMMDATDAPEPHSPYAAPAKAGPYLDEVGRSPGRLRIAWSDGGRELHADVRATLEATAETLSALGHEVFERSLGLDYRALYGARAAVSGANFAAGMARTIAEVGREPEPDELEPMTAAALKGSRKVTGEQAFHGLQELRMLTRQVLSKFEAFDVYLCPVMTVPPTQLGYLSPVENAPGELNRRQGEVYPYTATFNFTGQPSLSLPLGMSGGGLPIGMMFTARYADEATLFRLAGQLEKEIPWAGRCPPG